MARIMLVLGAAGSGKTTFIGDVVRSCGDTQKIAVLFNDDGDPEAVDLPEDLGKYADVTNMTAGCFGCADAGAFLERIEVLRDSVDLILVEPVGFIDADEMLGMLAVIKVKPVVVAVIDAAHHARNLEIGTVEGHVAAADVALVTKFERRDEEFDVIAWAMQYCPNVQMHAAGDAFDAMAVQKHMRFKPLAAHACGHAHHGGDHAHEHGAHCDHDHAEAHGHAELHDHAHAHHHHFHVATFHARLADSVTVELIRAVLADFPRVIRAKGDVAGGAHFDLVQGSWQERSDGGTVPYITFYTAPQDKEEGDACLEALQPHFAPGWGGLTGTAAATRGGTVSLETVTYQLELCRSKPITFSAGHPVPNPEWHELLNELRKRPGVPEAVQAACVRERMAHYLRCAQWYAEHPDREQDIVAPPRLHATAVGAAWFASEMAGRLTPEMIAEARSYPIARWLAIGLHGRDRLNLDAGKELVVADEAAVSACWAPALPADRSAVLKAWRHNLALAHASNNAKIIDAWSDSFARVISVH